MIRQRTLLKIITAGLYVVPLTALVFWQTTLHPFITLKTFTFHILIELIAIPWLLLILWYPEFRPKIRSIGISLLVLLGILVIASAIGFNPIRSIWSTPERAIGLFSLAHFFLLFLILSSLKNIFSWRKYWVYTFFVAGAVSLLGMVEVIAPQVFFVSGGERLGSTLGNPAFLASYLLFSIGIGAYLLFVAMKEHWNGWKKISLAAVLLLQIIVFFLANTRGAILGFGAGILVLLAMYAVRKRKEPVRRNIPLVVLIGVLAFGGIFAATRQSDFWKHIPGLNRLAEASLSEGAINNRLITWNVALESFKERPLTGWGFENFRYAFDQHYNPTLLRTGFAETYWDKPHNIFLEMLVSGGVFGLLAYLALFAIAGWVISKKTSPTFRPFGLGLLIAYGIQNIFIFDTFGSYLMFFVLLAYLATEENARAPVRPGRERVSERSSFLWAVAGLGGAAMLALVLINGKIVYANNAEYWGLNYFVNYLPDQAFASYDRALSVVEPYRYFWQQDFLAAVEQIAVQLQLPNAEQNIRWALDEYAKAVAQDPNNYFVYAERAELLIALHEIIPSLDLNQAAQDLEKAMALSPGRQQNYYISAKLKNAQGDFIGALSEMQKAIDLDPEVGDPYFYYALLAFDAGDTQKAIAMLEEAKQRGRTARTIEEDKLLGTYFGDLVGDRETAWQYLNEGLERSLAAGYDDLDLKLKVGLASYWTDRRELAKALFEDVLAKSPTFKQSAAYQLLGPVFKDLGIQTE